MEAIDLAYLEFTGVGALELVTVLSVFFGAFGFLYVPAILTFYIVRRHAAKLAEI